MPLAPFQRMCRAFDVLIDQFKLGAFGGIMFKAMAVGCPIVTYLNEELVLRQYSEVPPVMNCFSTEEIKLGLTQLIEDENQRKNLSLDTLRWIKRTTVRLRP